MYYKSIFIAVSLLSIMMGTNADASYSYRSDQEAMADGCKILYLKDATSKNCVKEEIKEHQLVLNIFDSNGQGVYVKKDEICLPSWNEDASVDYRDLFGDGRQAIIATFEGDTGTGTEQKILSIIIWQITRFIPILSETISYKIGSLGYQKTLKSSLSFENIKSNRLEVKLVNEFEVKNQGKYPFDFKASWNDKLVWNLTTNSFYDDKYERQMLKAPFYVRRNIANVRLKMIKIQINNYCADLFDNTGIMDILSDQK